MADFPKRYDRMGLVHVYLCTQAIPESLFGITNAGYWPGEREFNDIVRTHHRTVLDGLSELFGAPLDQGSQGRAGKGVTFHMFTFVVRSFLRIGPPWGGYIEASFLQARRQPGEIGTRMDEASSRIEHHVDGLRQAHLDLLDALARELLGDRAELIFTSADLRAKNIDDHTPDFEAWIAEGN